MKKILTIVLLLFMVKAGAQTSVTEVSCSSGKFYVRVTFTDDYIPPHNVSTVSCPDGIHYNTEESQYLQCYMELFADAACMVPVPVDPRFFEYQNVITGSHGTRPLPSFMYIPDCAAPLPSSSEYKDNWRTDRYLVTKTNCNWQCTGGYNCTNSGPGVPTNYNIIINCCFGPTVLEVHLADLRGQRDAGVNLLSWRLENRTDLARLVLERSFDGINYFPLFTSTDANVTSYSDRTAQTAYYRLRLFNQNGNPVVSPVVLLKAELAPGGFAVWPSPFKEVLQVSVTAARRHTAVFTLFAAEGRTVFRAERVVRWGTNQFIFFLPLLPPGLYILRMTHAEETVTTQLLKQ